MKKIISGLLLGLFCTLSFSGVAFAVVCPEGYKPSGEGCASWATFCADPDRPDQYYIPEIKKDDCVTAEEMCTFVKQFYDPDSKQCVPGVDFCAKTKAEYDAESHSCKACSAPEIFDPTIKSCYDPNETPSTVVPTTKFKETDCELMFQYDAYKPNTLKNIVKSGKTATVDGFKVEGVAGGNKVSPLDVLGCAIKTGRIHLWMIPFYIKYFIQFALSLAGLVAVGAIIIGGYFYLFGSFADDKDKGKRAIIYGIVGFIIAILAWTIVNVVISIATR